MTFLLVMIFSITFLVPLLPLLVRGAPFIGDSWVHMGLARGVLASGRYGLASYNERWPLVNFLLVFLSSLTGFSELQASWTVPLLVGLSALPLYALCRRLGLPRASALVPALFVSLNPLYAYVTFSGAVMKETSAFYLAVLLLHLASMGKYPSVGWMISMAVVGFGLVLGHHYASLVAFLSLWAYAAYGLFGWLRGENPPPKAILYAASAFTVPFSLWNWLNYLTLGAFFPIFEASDILLLLAVFTLSWFTLLADRGIISRRAPWLASSAFIISVLGLRGGLYIMAQPVEPITVWEARNYAVAAVFSLAGLSAGLDRGPLRAWAASTVSMVLFAPLWGQTMPGFTLLIKALHYYGILLAVGAGFTASWILRRRGGWLIVAATLIFMAYASSTGTILALNGLGAYGREEVELLRGISFSPGIKLYGDTRAAYLLPYTSNITASGLKPLRMLDEGSIMLLFRPNWEQGFLMGYDWVAREAIAPEDQLMGRGRVYDSAHLRIIT